MAIFSLVPTPSVVATRIGSRKPAALGVEEGAESAQAGIAASARRGLRKRLDRLDQRIAGIDIHAGIAIGEAVSVRSRL